jgi:uncharacterized membrane protein/mono/diheme cytochrome c family protein
MLPMRPISARRLALLAVTLVLTFPIIEPVHAATAAPRVSDISDQVSAVFERKCAECHSPQARKIKKFSYINDLARLSANADYITPRDPDHSKLWLSIRDGEMPPDDSDVPPLSNEQKQIVRQWIEVGAPARTAIAQLPPAPSTASALGRRMLRFVGKMHPLLAHFPIALIFAATMAELAWLRLRQPWLTGAVRFCVTGGALGAVAAGGLGWINAYFHTTSTLLTTHRWLGVFAILWMVPLVLLCERGVRAAPVPLNATSLADWTGRSRRRFEAALFASALLIGVAAHLGGSLVYGADYFKF